MVVKLVHALNACSEIIEMLFDRVTDDNLIQLTNAHRPISLILSGSDRIVKLVQYANASLPIRVTLVGIERLAIPEHQKNV